MVRVILAPSERNRLALNSARQREDALSKIGCHDLCPQMVEMDGVKTGLSEQEHRRILAIPTKKHMNSFTYHRHSGVHSALRVVVRKTRTNTSLESSESTLRVIAFDVCIIETSGQEKGKATRCDASGFG